MSYLDEIITGKPSVEKPTSNYEQYVDLLAPKYQKIKPEIVKGVIQRESSWDKHATADTKTRWGKARGLGQFIDETAQQYIPDWKSPADSYNPQKNIEGIYKYLSDLIDQEGTIEKALVRYHGGGTDVFGTKSEDYAREVLSLSGGKQQEKPEKSYLDEFMAGVSRETKVEPEPTEVKPLEKPKIETAGLFEGKEYMPKIEPAPATTTAVETIPAEERIQEPKKITVAFEKLLEKGRQAKAKIKPVIDPETGKVKKLTDKQIKEILTDPEEAGAYYILENFEKRQPQIAATGAALSGMVPFINMIMPEQIQEIKAKHPWISIPTEIAATIATLKPGANIIGKAFSKVPVLAKSKVLTDVATRMTTAGVSSATKQDWKRDFGESLANTIQSAGGGLVSVIPEIYAPPNAWQLILQPMTDAIWDVGAETIRGKDVFSKKWMVNELINLAPSAAFAIRDVASGETFKADQTTKKAEINNFINKAKGNIEINEFFPKGTKTLETPGGPTTVREGFEKTIEEKIIPEGLKAGEKPTTTTIPVVPKPGEEQEMISVKPGEIEVKKAPKYQPTEEEIVQKTIPPTEAEIKAEEERRKIEGVEPLKPTEIKPPEKPAEAVKLTPEEELRERVQAEPPKKEPKPILPEAEMFEKPKIKGALEGEEGATTLLTGSAKQTKGEEKTVSFDDKSFMQKLTGKIKRAIKQFRSEGLMPEELHKITEQEEAAHQARMYGMKNTVDDFRKQLDIAYPKGISDKDTYTIGAALKGESVDIPENLREPIKIMRREIDALSDQLIKSGVTNEDLKITIDKNKGIYVTRAYRSDFEGNKWIKKVPPNVINRAMAKFKQDINELNTVNNEKIEALYKKKIETPELAKEIDKQIAALESSIIEPNDEYTLGLMKSLLFGDKGTFASKGITGEAERKILKHKLDLSPEYRALKGEYVEADIGYALSIARMSSLLSKHNMMSRMIKEGAGKYFFDKPTKENYIKLIDEDSNLYKLLGSEFEKKNVYVNEDMKKAFDHMTKSEKTEGWLKWYLRTIGAVKYAKTILNPVGHTRNPLTNVFISVANGDTNLIGTIKMMTQDIPTRRGFIQKMTNLGLIGGSARMGELNAILKDAGLQGIDYIIGSKARRKFNKVARIPEKAWTWEDDIFKINAYLSSIDAYKKAYAGKMTDAEIELKLADNIKDRYPTYSRVPPAMQYLGKRFPFVGDFVSFNWERMRNVWGTLKTIEEEMKTPGLRGLATKRLAGLTTALSLPMAIALMNRQVTGVTKEDEKATRKFLAYFDKDMPLIFTSQPKEGKVGVLNLGYTYPYEYLYSPVQAFMRGENWEEKILESTSKIFEPFLQEDIITQKIIDLSRNERKTGGKVYLAEDNMTTKMEKAFLHFAEGMEPGVVNRARRYYAMLSGQTKKSGEPYIPRDEILNTLSGLRKITLDLNYALPYKIGDFQKRKQDINLVEKKEGSEKAIKKMLNNYSDMYDLIISAQTLGLNRQEIKSALIKQHVSQEEANALLDGTYINYLSKKYAERGQK